jgi:GTP-binding protein LepA
MSYDIKKIRNFSIIAHIDHGKSTIADRIIQICGGLEEREMQEQVLDNLDIEKERGITIKSQAVRLSYVAKNGEEYVFNLMDTPGHVDFGYEVSRCLSACEGAILVVDSTQGVQAQTLANAYKAIDVNNEILPILNKIDLQNSDVKGSCEQIENIIGLDMSEPTLVSGKTGEGINELLEKIIERIPSPTGDVAKATKALLIDAWYDPYLGVMLLVRVIDGFLEKGMKIKMKSNEVVHEIESIGYFTPKKKSKDQLLAGEVGYITANIKKVKDCNIGDTIVLEKDISTEALPGFKKVKPSVFCGIYPVEQEDYQKLKEALERLALNDASIFYETESSTALGLGFRCGFLGLLHLDVIFERLTEEFEIDLVSTAPSVVYKIHLRSKEILEIDNPSLMPDASHIHFIEEPIVKVSIITPEEHLGSIMKLCLEKRGVVYF